MNTEETFYFDEFCASDNGVEVEIPIRGRKVPLRIRRGLTLKEKVAAQSSAVNRRVDPTTGRIEIVGIDEAGAAEAIAMAMLVSWPFVNRDGTGVPITRENVSKLLGGMSVLVELAQKMEVEGDAALVPFAKQSTTAFAANQPLDPPSLPAVLPSA